MVDLFAFFVFAIANLRPRSHHYSARAHLGMMTVTVEDGDLVAKHTNEDWNAAETTLWLTPTQIRDDDKEITLIMMSLLSFQRTLSTSST